MSLKNSKIKELQHEDNYLGNFKLNENNVVKCFVMQSTKPEKETKIDNALITKKIKF